MPFPVNPLVLAENSPPVRNRCTVEERERILAISREVVTTVNFRLTIFRAIYQEVVDESRKIISLV